MNNTIIVAIIAGFVSLPAPSISFYFTKKHERDVQLRAQELEHYKLLLTALSDLAVAGMDKDEANRRFALAVNTISLAAPQRVIHALMAFHDEVKFSNPSKSPERHDKLLNELLLAVRRDIGLAIRVWRFRRFVIRRGVCWRLHSRSAGAPSLEVVSGGISGAPRMPRDGVRRAVCVGLSRPFRALGSGCRLRRASP